MFVEDTICLFTGVKLVRYVSSTCENYDNYELDDDTVDKSRKTMIKIWMGAFRMISISFMIYTISTYCILNIETEQKWQNNSTV